MGFVQMCVVKGRLKRNIVVSFIRMHLYYLLSSYLTIECHYASFLFNELEFEISKHPTCNFKKQYLRFVNTDRFRGINQ